MGNGEFQNGFLGPVDLIRQGEESGVAIGLAMEIIENKNNQVRIEEIEILVIAYYKQPLFEGALVSKDLNGAIEIQATVSLKNKNEFDCHDGVSFLTVSKV